MVRFSIFGAAHLGAIALTLATPLALCAVSRLDNVTTIVITWLFVALLVGAETMKFILLHRDGELGVETAAPMHLCNWAMIAAVSALIIPNQWTYELCYFCALGGTLEALLTPDLSYGFPDPRFIKFFMLHGRVIASAL